VTSTAVPARTLVLRAVGIFAVGRVATLAWILGVGAHRGLPLSQTIGYWDGLWYIQAAKGGWPSVAPNMPPETLGQDTTAFFPGYPLVIRLVHVTGLSWPASALAATLLAGAAASAVIAVLVQSFAPARVALLTVALWALQPESFVLSVAFSEALFTALAAATLLALVRRHWLAAGLLAAAASATRSVAAALTVAAVVAAALVLAIVLWRMASVPIEVRLYGVAFFLLLLVTGNSYASLPRLLVPAFPLLIPIAQWLSRRSTAAVTGVLALSLAAACYLGVLWFDTIRLATHCCAP
jgi:hypothetical protein